MSSRRTIHRCDASAVLENLSAAVMVLDQNLTIAYMNPSAETLLSISKRRATNQPLEKIVRFPDRAVERLRSTLATGHSYTDREIPVFVSGEPLVTVDYSVSPQSGGKLGTCLILEMNQVDRHLRIAREEALIAQQQVSRSLVRGLAHEIKNPLGGLRGAAQLLEKELSDPALREYTRIIIDEADRLQNLVNRMLGPNSLPNKTVVNIHEITEHVHQLIAAEAGPGIKTETNYDPSIPPLIADRDWIIQALLNIARNALQAVQAQGTITFRTRTLRQFTIGAKRYRLVAQIEVIDDGPGLPEDMTEAIFYPLITGRSGGTGLGLSIAQSLVNLHGGLIECKSRPGQTVFKVLLPLELQND